MRIAVSDFDGTIKLKGEVRGDVAAAVRKWRGAGNRFGIATRRDLWMTVHETDRLSLPFDFLICINGAAVYDRNRTLLAICEFEQSISEELLLHPAAMASAHYLLLGAEPIRYYQREESWFPEMGIPYAEIDLDAALAARSLAQISLSYENQEECQKWMRLLADDFGERVAAFRNGRCIDVNCSGVSKSSGIARMLEATGGGAEDVVVIGDGGNDLEMFRDYAGYCVPNAIPEVKALARGEFADVAEMLNSV